MSQHRNIDLLWRRKPAAGNRSAEFAAFLYRDGKLFAIFKQLFDSDGALIDGGKFALPINEKTGRYRKTLVLYGIARHVRFAACPSYRPDAEPGWEWERCFS